MPLATVVIPTFDHGPLLRHAVRSALGQNVDDLELFIVGDGVPPVTREIVAKFGADRRVRFFDHPKHPSRGETHRHAALQAARGEIVCYLSDDDLWLPDHVATMHRLLVDADFANTLPLRIDAAGAFGFYVVDLALSADRELLLKGTNRVPLSCAAHTLAAYRALPHGWRTTPRGTATDLSMWQQFLAEPTCRAVSGTRPTVLNFPSPLRADWTDAARLAELAWWSERIANADWRDRFLGAAFDAIVREYASESVRLRTDVENHRRWVEGLQRRLADLEAGTADPSRTGDPARSIGRRTAAAQASRPIHFRLPRELEPDLDRVRAPSDDAPRS